MAQLRLVWIGLLFTIISASPARANDIGYIETFALADARSKALKKLIPNTSSYFYYRALHNQNLGKLDKVDALLTRWRGKLGSSRRVVEIEHRQALLRYAQSPLVTLAYLRKKLSLHFAHQPPVAPTSQRTRPTRYAPKTLRATMLHKAQKRAELSRYPGGLKATTFYQSASVNWSTVLLSKFLGQLKRPDHPQLVAMVAKELRGQAYRFGRLTIHRKMLLAQLQALSKLLPSLNKESTFIRTYIKKLQPSHDAGGLQREATKDAYIGKLWEFVKGLSPAQGGLKQHVLYHLLQRDRRRNKYSTRRLLAYLQLPRATTYANPTYLQRPALQQYRIKGRSRQQRWTGLARSYPDNRLVRDTLEALLQRGAKAATFAPYLRASYLQKVQIEAMLLRGKEVRKWRKKLPPRAYKALQQRVDLRFAPHNKHYYKPGETIRLGVQMKHTPTLLIKVYRLNSKHYYSTAAKRRGKRIQLDSLIANRERRLRYRDNPMRRITRWYRFSRLQERGIYAIDFIGNGKVIRAVVRKGRLFATQTLTATGHRFTVFDERGRQLKDASVWLGDQEYTPNTRGHIYLPMTHVSGNKRVYLQHKGFASPFTFLQRKETYSLDVGFYVDREALLKGQMATLLYQPKLSITGVPTSISLLSHARLQVKATDRFGVQTLKTIVGPKLYDRKESRYRFLVPPDLATLQFTLRGRVYNMSKRSSQKIESTHTIQINQIDAGTALMAWHLQKIQGGYVLSLRDKAGKGLAGRLAEITLNVRGLTTTRRVSLQSDAKGRIVLQNMQDVVWITAKTTGCYRSWQLRQARSYQPDKLNGTTATAFSIPYSGQASKPLRREWALLERRDGAYVRDAFERLSLKGGYLHIEGLTAGDYELYNRRTQKATSLHVTAGSGGSSSKKASNEPLGWSTGRHRVIGAPEAARAHITKLQMSPKGLAIRVAHPSASTRVHVLATRFVPLFDVYRTLRGGTSDLRKGTALQLPRSEYQKARSLSRELQYILARKYTKKYPGNMLKRPGLLLQPWSPARHTIGKSAGLGGLGTRGFGGGGGGGRGHGYGGRKGVYGRGIMRMYKPNLDYMRHPSKLLANLRPDATGTITIPRSFATHHPHVHIVLIDKRQSAYKQFAFPDTPLALRDIRMKNTLAPTQHFAQRVSIKRLTKGQRHLIKPRQFARFTAIDSLSKAYALLQTQRNTKAMQAFRFVLRWPQLSNAEKQKYYSRFACHELHLFLYRKDRAFFRKVVKPYLQNKLHKTFLDRWLLGADLSVYWRPWRFARLNIVEKILLGRRYPRKLGSVQRHLRDQLAAKTRNLHHEHKLLMTALESGRLDLASLATTSASREVHRYGSADPGATKRQVDSADHNQSPARIKQYKRLLEEVANPLTAEQKRQVQTLLKLHQERQHLRSAYTPVKRTQELAETHYFHRPLAYNDARLITPNPFWQDLAMHSSGRFLSKNLAHASRHFSEMMLALSFLDLPFASKGVQAKFTKKHIRLQTKGAAIVYIAQLRRAKAPKARSQLLVRQHCFRTDRRGRLRAAATQYEVHTRIGCEIVVTNPETSAMTLDLLLQIPRGAIPLRNTKRTHSKRIRLAGYRTFQHKYFFTFTTPGRYNHFPVHVSYRGKLLAYAPATPFQVTLPSNKVDQTSWTHVAARGTAAQVLQMLKRRNLHKLNLSRIAWRMKRRSFFQQVIAILRRRHIFHSTLWSYGIFHDDKSTIRTYLQRRTSFRKHCGLVLDSPLLTITAQAQRTHQHFEYTPVINARAHRYRPQRSIANDALAKQYARLLKVFAYKARLSARDRISLTYYLLLQDRTKEALAQFKKISAKELATKLQYDYFRVYLAFYESRYSLAKRIATRHRNYPVLRWRKLFLGALQQLKEVQGPTSRASITGAQATHAEASFDFKVEANTIRIEHQHIKKFQINYHVMDVELLFSRNPFVQKQTGPFAMLVPRRSQKTKARRTGRTRVRLPWRLRSQNVIVEVVGAGVHKVRHYHANSLRVQVLRRIGQVRVLHRRSRRPLKKVYVKIYAKNRRGKVSFFKDGYTDLRGRFDYTSLQANALAKVSRFAILIASPRHGATIRYTRPPNH